MSRSSVSGPRNTAVGPADVGEISAPVGTFVASEGEPVVDPDSFGTSEGEGSTTTVESEPTVKKDGEGLPTPGGDTAS